MNWPASTASASRWEAAASLQLRAGNRAVLDVYDAHGRIIAGPFDEHLDRIARDWLGLTADGHTVAITAATNDHVDALNDAVQRVRLTVGDLRPNDAVEIGGGEVAYRGDVVATRRNHRHLRTTTGEPVRNRDRWDVTSTHRDGSLTVSHRAGHGTVTLPAGYVGDHVRLGYAATEYGHQGDTVDVAIALVSTATTQRGLYVGATRGRDDNRLHVVTDSDDLADARDVLEVVLAHDRADIPAVTQRRELARHTHAAPTRRHEPVSIVPGWVGPWRAQLAHRRDDLVGSLAERADRRAAAAADYADLQPALTAARAAWEPYRAAIAAIDDELRTVLRPAMWTANHDALRAGFGHHHTTARRATAANRHVAAAEARIAAIGAGATDVKHRLDTIQARARNLHDLAQPSPGGYGLDDLNRQHLDDVDRLLHAVDVWTAWAHGRPVTTADLIDTAEILTDTARHAPLYTTTSGAIDRSHWLEALEPLVGLLRQQGVDLHDPRDLERAGHDLGLEL